MGEDFTLYGMQASLYTGKVRAYMRRNRIPVTERGAGHADFAGKILPKIGRFIMPVIESPDGEVVQDGTDILDYLEGRGVGREPLYPQDPVTRAVALLLELFGNEGLLRPAMHYRWNFDEENLDFLKVSFSDVFPDHLNAKARADMFEHASGRMRKAAMAFGVIPDTYEAIEKSYKEFLSLLNAHLKESYFLLGSKPTIADYGLFNPLYAHLSRDPKPSHLMKTTAPYVWNWVERMNRPEEMEEHTIDTPPTQLFSGKNLPDSLMKVLAYISEDYADEFVAHVNFANQWLSENETPVDVSKSGLGRGIGLAKFTWHGRDIKSVVMLYRFYLAQRLWDHFDSVTVEEQADIRTVFTKAGLARFLDERPKKRVLRKNYQEVWST